MKQYSVKQPTVLGVTQDSFFSLISELTPSYCSVSYFIEYSCKISINLLHLISGICNMELRSRQKNSVNYTGISICVQTVKLQRCEIV